MWLGLLFLLNILLINFAITINHYESVPRTPISYTIFQGAFLSRIALYLTKLLPSLIFVRVFLTGLSAIGLFAVIKTVHFIVGKNEGLLAGLLYCLSPPNLFFQSTINPLAILVFLLLSGILLYLTSSLLGKLFGTLLLVVSAFLSPAALIITGIIFIFNILRTETFRKTKVFLGILFSISVVSFYILTEFEFAFPKYVPTSILEITFEFGNIFGIFIITLIYGLIGLFVSKIKKQKKVLIVLLIGSTLLLFQSLYYLPFANIIFCIFAGVALKDLITKEWNIKNAKIATAGAIFAVLLLSTLSFFTTLPSINLNSVLIKESKDIIKGYPLQNLSSHPYYLPLLNYMYAQENNLARVDAGPNSKTDIYPIQPSMGLRRNLKEILEHWNNTKRYNNKTISDIFKLYYSRNIEDTLTAARELGIKYIIITDEMRNGLVWEYDEEGLLFLLRNKEVFSTEEIQTGLEKITILKNTLTP